MAICSALFISSPQARNSFEMAVITDGRDSFVLFNFLNIEWTRAATLAGRESDPFAQSGVSEEAFVYELPISGQGDLQLYKK